MFLMRHPACGTSADSSELVSEPEKLFADSTSIQFSFSFKLWTLHQSLGQLGLSFLLLAHLLEQNHNSIGPDI